MLISLSAIKQSIQFYDAWKSNKNIDNDNDNIIQMNRVRRTKSKWSQETPNFRSVGSKPCDFNRMKYTTTYRPFGRRSLPNLQVHDQNEQDKQIINLNLKTNSDKQRQVKLSPRKKTNVIVDKWKQRYEKIEEQFIRKKGVSELFPTINRNAPLVMISTKQKFHLLRKIHKNKITNEEQKAMFHQALQKRHMGKQMSQTELDEVFHKYDEEYKQSWFQRLESEKEKKKELEYSLELPHKQKGVNLKFKKKSVSNLQPLKALDQIPQRWEFTQQDD